MSNNFVSNNGLFYTTSSRQVFSRDDDLKSTLNFRLIWLTVMRASCFPARFFMAEHWPVGLRDNRYKKAIRLLEQILLLIYGNENLRVVLNSFTGR